MLAGGLFATEAPAGASSSYAPIPAGPITLGVSTSFSGANASFGIFTKQGFNVAFAQFKQQYPNGIDGHQVNLDFIDDQSSVTGAVNAANKMVSEHAAAAITLTTDAEAVPAQVAILQKAKVPIISTMESDAYGNPKLYPYYFTETATPGQDAVAAAKWIGAKGFTSIATLNDGVASGVNTTNMIVAAMKKYAPKAKVTTQVTIAPGSVDDTVAVTKLKAANPQLVMVYSTYGYGPLWQAMHAANWTPAILASAGVWYDGLNAMGSLEANAVSNYVMCASSANETFTSEQMTLFDQYNTATGGFAVNYLTFIANDSVPFYEMAYAINKYHSLDHNAIKKALEGIKNMDFVGIPQSFSATNHAGATGTFAAAVCNVGQPYAGGRGLVPVRAST
jgi:branched-chain amino acid transport system substrate-binding protein